MIAHDTFCILFQRIVESSPRSLERLAIEDQFRRVLIAPFQDILLQAFHIVIPYSPGDTGVLEFRASYSVKESPQQAQNLTLEPQMLLAHLGRPLGQFGDLE